MEHTMKRIRKNYTIKWLPIAVVMTLLTFVYIGIGTSTVSEIRDVIDTGYLNGVELNEEGMYEVHGEEVMTYPKYRYSVAFGESNMFNYALDGLSYTDTLGIGRKTFVFDYDWYNSTYLDGEKLVDYIDNNYWLMVFRMVAYSNQLVIAVILFTGMLVVNYWLMPILTHALASMFGLVMALKGTLAGDERVNTVRVYESRILRKTVDSYENSQFMYWVSGFNALMVSLYSVRFHEESSVFVALWVNVIIVLIYILNKIVVNHIKIVKQHKGKGER